MSNALYNKIRTLKQDMASLAEAIDEGLDFLTEEYFRVEGELLEAEALVTA